MYHMMLSSQGLSNLVGWVPDWDGFFSSSACHNHVPHLHQAHNEVPEGAFPFWFCLWRTPEPRNGARSAECGVASNRPGFKDCGLEVVESVIVHYIWNTCTILISLRIWNIQRTSRWCEFRHIPKGAKTQESSLGSFIVRVHWEMRGCKTKRDRHFTNTREHVLFDSQGMIA